MEDSRCPVDVQCIQAGTVRVNVQISDGIEYTEKILNLRESGTFFGDISISLKEVSPVPNLKVVLEPSDYVFTFEIKFSLVLSRPSFATAKFGRVLGEASG